MERAPEPGSPDVRVADADRQRIADLLRVHATEGRISLDEFSDRVGAALAARTQGELDSVVRDLPVPAPARPPPAPQAAARTRRLIGIFSGTALRGRWRVPRRVTAIAVMGGATVDLRGAVMESGEVEILAVAFWGGVDIIVPEGIAVDVHGVPVMGGTDVKLADVPVLPGSPAVTVRAYPVMGGVTVRSRRDRRDRAGAATAAEGPSPPPAARARLPRGRRRASYEPRARAGAPPIPVLPNTPSRYVPGMAAPDAATSTDPPPAEPPPADPIAVDDAGAVNRVVPGGTVTLLFSDIAGFTEATERLGDRAAHAMATEHRAVVRRMLAVHDGFELKDNGDGMLAGFPSAARALRCAVDVQRALDARNRGAPGSPIQVHQGVHTGEAIQDGDDLLGAAVNLASRIADAACAGEILASRLVRELAQPGREFTFGEARRVELKGLATEQDVFPVEWRL